MEPEIIIIIIIIIKIIITIIIIIIIITIIITFMTLRVAQEVELRSGTATACGQNWNEVVNLHSFLHGGRLLLKAIEHSLVYWGDSLRK